MIAAAISHSGARAKTGRESFTNRARIAAARVRFNGITKKRDRIFIRHWEAS
jgi:hypothetical protein